MDTNPATLDGFEKFMGRYALDPYGATAETGPAVYNNMFGTKLYWKTSTSRWVITDDYFAALVSDIDTVGHTPLEAFSADGEVGSFKAGSTPFNLARRSFVSCGAASDCNCPDPEYECAANVEDLACYEGQIMQPLCGSRDRCCAARSHCTEEEWGYPDAERGRCIDESFDMGKKPGTNYCPIEAGCSKELCCARSCYGLCREKAILAMQNHVCEPDGCTEAHRDICCLVDEPEPTPEPTPPTPAPIRLPTHIIKCEECVGPDETHADVVRAGFTVTNLKYTLAVNNYNVRTEAVMATAAAIAGLIEQVSTSQVILKILPDEATDPDCKFEALLLAQSGLDAAHSSLQTVDESGVLNQTIQDALDAVSSLNQICIGDPSVSGLEYIERVTAIHERRLASEIGTRGEMDIWFAHLDARVRTWTQQAWANIYVVLGVTTLVGVFLFATCYWYMSVINADYDDNAEAERFG